MKFIDYLKDKTFDFFIYILGLLLLFCLLVSFKLPLILIALLVLFIFCSYIIILFHDYYKRKTFYNNIDNKLKKLDKKYFISEMVSNSNFLDGEKLLNYLYEINKSYIEGLNNYKYSIDELKEYIELWCHEIKTPIATSKLIIDNNKNKITTNIEEEIDRIDSLVEQVLFYFRSDNVKEDYIINCDRIIVLNDGVIEDSVQNVIKKNKKSLLAKKITVDIFSNDVMVESDSKWLEFIINQIVTNSIKYSKDINATITVSVKENTNNILLSIKDNGIGITSNELKKVFNKGFTGSNGRKKYNSTGIGLYLCQKLCQKLGHNITISSKENKETIINIVFPFSSMYKK